MKVLVFYNMMCFLKLKNSKLFKFDSWNRKIQICSGQHIMMKSVVSRTLPNAALYKWVKTQRNESDLIKYPNYFLTCARWQTLN